MTVQRRHTAADLEGLNITPGARIELLDGEIPISLPGSALQHQWTTAAFVSALYGWNKKSRLGLSVMAPGVGFGPHDEVVPDTMWISRERRQGSLNEHGHLVVAPELDGRSPDARRR